MFSLVAYFVVTYGCVISVCVALALLLRRSKTNLIWRLAFVAVLLGVPLVPYLRVALQTAAHKEELMPAFRTASTEVNGDWEAPFIFRVLSIDSAHAIVYSVDSCAAMTHTKGNAGGTTWELKKTPRGWKFTGNYDAVWSDCGSAEGNTFPPYPEANEF